MLEERSSWLRDLARQLLRDAPEFWRGMRRLPRPSEALPKTAARLLGQAMPDGVRPKRVVRRTAGLGSLGHRRYVALAPWCGAYVAREVKAMSPPASVWAGAAAQKIGGAELLARAVRCADPTVLIRDGWTVRRLSPDCIKIEIDSLPSRRYIYRLLRAMGREIANMHLGSKEQVAKIAADVRRRTRKNEDWLQDAAERMLEGLIDDWRLWRKERAARFKPILRPK